MKYLKILVFAFVTLVFVACGGGEYQQTKLVKEYTQIFFDNKAEASVDNIFNYYIEANKKINSLASIKRH